MRNRIRIRMYNAREVNQPKRVYKAQVNRAEGLDKRKEIYVNIN